MKDKIWIAIATAGPLGYTPRAPGTAGSIPGIFIGAWLQHPPGPVPRWLYVFTVLFFLSGIAIKAIDTTESIWQKHDDRKIVIDEVIGQSLVSAFVPLTWQWLALSFIVFRIFDIWKPWPINVIDRRMTGALGTLLDDIFAALAALACLFFVKWL